jgi:hypothetical protein
MGNAVVKFENAFDIEPNFLNIFKNDLHSTLPNEDTRDEFGNIRTEGGYEISSKYIESTPTRYPKLDSLSSSGKDFVKQIQESMHNCVIEYCKIFPVVIENIRWVTNGYFIKYENGQNIGPHSDCNIAYAEDNITVINSIPVYNVLTVAAFLNDDFDGGEVSWRIWGITSKPKVGSIVIYPSSFVGCHEVAPVNNGTRYAYLRWYGHGEIPYEPNESVLHLLQGLKASNHQQKFVPVGRIGA